MPNPHAANMVVGNDTNLIRMYSLHPVFKKNHMCHVKNILLSHYVWYSRNNEK